MAYYAAILRMKDPDLSRQQLKPHVDYLEALQRQGRIHAMGTFPDGSGGMVVYVAGSLEAARELAEADPFIALGARELELHEWALK